MLHAINWNINVITVDLKRSTNFYNDIYKILRGIQLQVIVSAKKENIFEACCNGEIMSTLQSITSFITSYTTI